MTGYGGAKGKFGDGTISVEITALNGKALIVDYNIPACFERFRTHLEKLIRPHVSRGTLKIRMMIDEFGEDVYEVDEESLERYWNSISEASERLGLTKEIDPAAVAALPGVIRRKHSTPITEEQWNEAASAVESAIGELVADRTREGSCINEELSEILPALMGLVKEIENMMPEVNAARHERYSGRLKEIAGKLISEDVIAREAAVIAEKHDISEELHRLAAHMEEFSRLLEINDAVGRKLGFLSQEMHREAATMCSKADDLKISHTAMEIRANIQQIKELVLNVE